MRRALIAAACLCAAACGGGTQAASSHASVADRCAAEAGKDPAKMSLCLASHHAVLSSTDARLRHCLDGARDDATVVGCMQAAAR